MIPELRQTLPSWAGESVASHKTTKHLHIQESTYAVCIRD
jgi:hypothetical protein